MGDSWDETSFDVSEADARSLAKHVDSEDLDDEIFGGLAKKPDGNKSLLKAMQQSTGKGIFDDEDTKSSIKTATVLTPKTNFKKTVQQSIPKSSGKPTSNDDDDLLADLLGDSDYSEASQQKTNQVPLKSNEQIKTFPKRFDNTKNIQATSGPNGKPKERKDVLFDANDGSDLLGMIDSKKDTRGSNDANIRNQTPPRNEKKTSKPSFGDMINRTSLLKSNEEPIQKVNTPSNNDFVNSAGFSPSSGGRGRRGLNSGLQTPKSSAGLQPDDTFDMFLKDDADANMTPTPSKTATLEDMFRVDLIKSPPPVSRSQTPVNVPVTSKSGGPATVQKEMRPHTHDGTSGPAAGEALTQSRPPSAGRRAKTALPNRGAPPPGTPQRRNSDTADSLFADEDIPNKFLQADGSAQLWNNPTSPGPQTPVKIEDSTLPWEKPSTPGTRTPVETAPGEQAPDLPWEKPSGLQTPVKSALNSPLPWESKTPSGEPQVAAGTATQIILQQNSVLEKKISEIEEEKAQLQKKLTDSLSTHSEASKTQEKEAVDLKVLVDDLEAKLREKGKEMESTEKRFREAKEDVDQIEQRTGQKYKDDIEILEKRYKDQIKRLNIMLEEKENIIQDEVKSASRRLKEKEEVMLNENKGLLDKWERRVEETENRLERKMKEMTSDHRSEMSDLKLKHEDEIEEQKRMRKEELCAVLSVQKTASALQDLTEKVQLSAGEISNLSNKLDDNRSVSLEERERAARVMSEYLHDLKQSLERQEKDISQERNRVQELVSKMEKHLREQTRISNAAHDKLIKEEARFRTMQASWEADKAEDEQKLERAREQFEKSKAVLLNERKEQLEGFYKERKEIAEERSRLSNVSQKATEKVAKGAVRQLDIEAQAKAMLDQAKREVTQIKAEKNTWDKDQKTRQVVVESLEQDRKELANEKYRLSKLAEKLADRSKDTETYNEALQKAREECVVVQQQLAKLETDIRMREDETKMKERTLREAATALAAEKELLRHDRGSLNAEGIQCPACQKYRPRSSTHDNNNIRSSSPIRPESEALSPTLRRSLSPLRRSLSPLNLTFQSNSSVPGSRYKYPSPRVVELTGSLQRLGALSDQQTLQMQKEKINKFKEVDWKILSSSYT